jgi:hypothetical protein
MEVDNKTATETSGDIVVFSILKPSACAECGAELWKGSFLRMEKEKPLCLECADLDHLVFLPRGDVALTRRSRKYSTLSAVVVRFSRSRKRYERQGLLVESGALERAQEECLSDEGKRQFAREKASLVRERADEQYVAQFTDSIRSRYPDCPPAEAEVIAKHACEMRSTAGELAALLRQSHLMRRQWTLRSRLMFVIRTPSTIGYCLEGGNERRRGRLCWTE